jgi:hypothetical protein
MPAENAFPLGYHDARAYFLQALDTFEQRTGRVFARSRCVIDETQDLTIDVAELAPPHPQRLYMVVAGLHGIEGFAGNAIQCSLLAEVLPLLDLEHSGVLLVHALNPAGMHRMRRVNASNVDLNRNFATKGSPLFATDSRAFQQLRAILAPQGPYDGSVASHLRFIALLVAAVARHGFATLREITLAGQYGEPEGIFYGGKAPEPETLFLQNLYDAICPRYSEILLTDLHTGYGDRAQAYALFGRVDSPELQEFALQGVRDARGRPQAYAAHGDLIGYCHDAAKRVRPDGVFNGVALEIGTHGLGTIEQIGDLHTIVRENQIRHHGARDVHVEMRVAREFCELFYPGDPLWRRQALKVAVQRIEGLLEHRGFFAAA